LGHAPRPVDHFQTTHWSLVLAAGRQSSLESDEALSALCRTYWQPLYTYVRRRVPDVHEAHDLTQEFFLRLLEKNYLAMADRQRGRFRAFLLTAFKHFLANEWAKAKTRKRGGGRSPIPLDFAAADSRAAIEPADRLTPEQIYDRQWAMTLLTRVIERLEDEYRGHDKQDQFERLKPFIVGQSGPITHATVAEALGSTEAAVKMAAHRLRSRYRQLLREEISQTVAQPADVEDEIRRLFLAFSG
jgi:RNA polymerase sigma-70 factor (ECF subfamily)